MIAAPGCAISQDVPFWIARAVRALEESGVATEWESSSDRRSRRDRALSA